VLRGERWLAEDAPPSRGAAGGVREREGAE